MNDVPVGAGEADRDVVTPSRDRRSPNFEGAPMVLVHHRGRKSGREYVIPMMYLPHETRPDSIYVFATKAGVYAEQARRYPGFAGYARQTAGVRTIPVLELRA